MKSFYVYENKDAAKAYVNALESAGYKRIKSITDILAADFILYDSEGAGGREKTKANFIRKRGPAFVYPHTPLTCWLWDGVYQPLPVACNFVPGKAQKAIMRAYGYPCRVETTGFPRCEVLPFIPCQKEKPDLLFVPARPRRDKGRQEKHDHAALTFIRDNRDAFGKVTVCRIAGQFPMLDNGNFRIKVITTNPKGTPQPGQDMIDRIDATDIVISVTTPSALAVARGKPTIMYRQGEAPESLSGRRAKSFEKYKDIYAYPLSLESMSIEDVLEFAMNGNRQVEHWKAQHIGGQFDAEKFLSIIQEYV